MFVSSSSPAPNRPHRDATIEASDFSIERICLTNSLCFDDYVTDPDEPLGRVRDIVVATRESNKAPFPLQLVPHLAR